MITESEINISNESYTRKDFYQIYPEVLDFVKNLTERWDPTSSNESDPGVVLLKVACFIADKLNYNIDKNILENYITSCTQEENMRKLCDMLGYDMHYYRSAETEVSFMWTKAEGDGSLAPTSEAENGLINFPMFETVLSDDSNEVTFVLLDSVQLTHRNQVQSGTAIEGTLCDFEVNTDNIVRYYNLDDNLRLYLPEIHVAENGIWIYNSSDTSYKSPWTKVTNLNIQSPDTKVWKLGYDNKKKLPYIQFPEDVVELMSDGLTIKYIRTSGASGNIKAQQLTSLVNSTTVSYTDGSGTVTDVEIEEDGVSHLYITNASASVNGADVETIDEAYNGFKKLIGTFNTLVTTRDYENAIYNLYDDANNPYVSNIVASDIRDDINYTNSVVTFDQYGCHAIVVPETSQTSVTGEDSAGEEHTISISKDKIDHFDLYLYPLKPITTSYTSKTYQNSFKPSYENYTAILNEINDYKTISHNIKTLNTTEGLSDVFCIKNKYKLEANITTTYKVNGSEQRQILNNIYTALYKNFNARKVDFGEKIPYDSVLSVIENADTRIKVVILEDFEIVPYVMLADGNEYLLSPETTGTTKTVGATVYKKLVAKNVLAGKLPLFNYDTDTKYKYGEQTTTLAATTGGTQSYVPESPTTTQPVSGSKTNSITYITTELNIPEACLNAGVTLEANEAIQFIAPAYKKILIYPAYTNYYFKKNDTAVSVPADTEYKMEAGEYFAIRFTDTDDNVNDVLFTDSKHYAYVNDVQTVNEDFSGIIEPNFVLKDSDTAHTSDSKAWVKKNITYNHEGTTVTNMFQLGPSEELAPKTLDRIVFDGTDESNIKCYWYTNEPKGTLTFTNGKRILDSGEYFFYTNESETVLATFGSGTQLEWGGTDSVWSLSASDEETLNIDDVSSDGIGAFSDVSWIRKSLDNTRTLIIQTCNIINLGEDDNVTFDGADLGNLTSAWKKLDSDQISEFTYNDTNKLTEGLDWSVRSILNLNVGPDTVQSLHEREVNSAYITKTVKTYTSTWKVTVGSTTYYVNPTNLTGVVANYTWSDLEEVPLFDNPTETFKNVDIKANYLLQMSGGEHLSTHRYKTDSTEMDDVLIVPFIQESCTQVTTSGGVTTSASVECNNTYTKLNLKNLTRLTLPVNLPTNKFGIISFYYVPDEDDEDVNICTTGTDSYINEYSKGPSTGTTTTEYTLKEGLNILRIENAQEVRVVPESGQHNGTLTFTQLSVVNFDENNKYGIDYTLLGIKKTDCESFYTTYIKNYTSFFINCPINNSDRIDVDTMTDVVAWENVNNICNKFTIGELDVTSFENIKIARSSRLS